MLLPYVKRGQLSIGLKSTPLLRHISENYFKCFYDIAVEVDQLSNFYRASFPTGFTCTPAFILPSCSKGAFKMVLLNCPQNRVTQCY